MTTAQADINTLQADVLALQGTVLDQVVANASNVAVGAVYADVITYTNAIGAENGTEWIVDTDFITITLPTTANYRVRINTVAIATFAIPTVYQYGKFVHILARAYKESNTSVRWRVEFEYSNWSFAIPNPSIIDRQIFAASSVVADLSANTLVIDVQASSLGADTTLNCGTIKKYTKV